MGKKKGFFDSVRTRLICIVALLVAIPLITVTIVNYAESTNDAKKNIQIFNNDQVLLVEDAFSKIVGENYDMTQTVANSVSARKVLLGELDVESVTDWLTKVDEEKGDGNSLIITNAEGMQIVRTVGDCVDVSDRDYFKKVKDGALFYVSDQNISKSSGQRICTFIHAIYDTDGTFIGAVQRNYDLGNFDQLVKEMVTEEKQDIFICDNNADVIAHSSVNLNEQQINLGDMDWFARSRASMDSTETFEMEYGGTAQIVSYRREPITGWVTVVTRDKTESMASAIRMAVIMVIIGLVMLVVAIVVTLFLANDFTKPIFAINDVLALMADGSFVMIEDKGLLGKKDEFGDIANNTNNVIAKLNEVISNIKNSASVVEEQAGNVADTSEQISTTSGGVSEAVEEMAKGATDQADTVQGATENIGMLSDGIQTVADNAEELADTAGKMNEASSKSAEAMKKLLENMDTMGKAVKDIAVAMKETGNSVNSVNEKVDGITAIATQTNLLALNASIEAARAGEAGRGFAVVAEEIGKLATDSTETAAQIKDEMAKLLVHSHDATTKTEEVSKLGEEVNEVLNETTDVIKGLINNVTSTVDGVSTISGLTEECNASKEQIIDAMSNLSAISEENAASTQETSTSMEELNVTVGTLATAAEELKNVSDSLSKEMAFFK